MIKIDKGLPLPSRSWKYPFGEMEIGDSCFVPETSANAVCIAARRYQPKKFAVRSVTENGVKGVRMWRVS